MAKSALLIVDLQNCFCPPNGELAVQDGDKIVNLVNQVIEFAKSRMWKIFASRDWHKKNSRHFSVNGGMWPVHGVENTWGARFHPDLILPEDAIIISKGMEICTPLEVCASRTTFSCLAATFALKVSGIFMVGM